jgi:hypothetical protein
MIFGDLSVNMVIFHDFPVRKFLNNQMGMSDYAEGALRFPEAAIR